MSFVDTRKKVADSKGDNIQPGLHVKLNPLRSLDTCNWLKKRKSLNHNYSRSIIEKK